MVSRWKRDEFFAKIDDMDTADLKRTLWTLYYRGAGPVRQRIEELVEPKLKVERQRAEQKAPAASDVLTEVRDFASLARAGSYLAGDRRVSPKERSRWRFTFRRLVKEAQSALSGTDVKVAGEALSIMVDLACEAGGTDYFRSDDPVEAAGFVVSDALTMYWSKVRQEFGMDSMLKLAVGHLLRWESPYGWTRRGFGRVAEKETSLANALAGFLTIPDHWETAASYYLDELDQLADAPPRRRQHFSVGYTDRGQALADWHRLLLEQLTGSQNEELLDRVAMHPALGGPEHTYFQARLAKERDDLDAAGRLIQESLKSLPGSPKFKQFAEELAALPTQP